MGRQSRFCRLAGGVIAALAVAVLAGPVTGPARASTLVVEGSMENTVEVSQVRRFAVPRGGLKRLEFRFAGPVNVRKGAIAQAISKRTLKYSPEPSSVSNEVDAFGNAFTVVRWEGLKKDAVVTESFTASLSIRVKDSSSRAPFPLPRGKVPAEVARYLKPSPMVESDSSEIKELAGMLTREALGEQEAVTGILNWVVDNVRYRSPVPEYGALWTLKLGAGNCQNLSHLSMALLRASGIPARIVGGITLKKPWNVPFDEGTLVQSIGQGGHAWIEVWYPDLGWVPYDAQQSHLFVGPRHIKQSVGPNATAINDSWKASPSLPRFSEDISAKYLSDDVKLRLKNIAFDPGTYILTGSLALAAPVEPVPAPAPRPTLAPSSPDKIVFGNVEFPSLVHYYTSRQAGSAEKTLDKETAEYVTGDVTYAQGFTVTEDMRLDIVSLAMHKFGGKHGSLWVDIVQDDNGRPGANGQRSLPVLLDKIKYRPGYLWFDFRFFGQPADRPLLTRGRWWIILRKSKDAIVNWFYTPGNEIGDEGDTRSTMAGTDFSYVLNADFNFRITGRPAY